LQDAFMTEITRVPLQPIRQGTLFKLWLGVAAVLLCAAGLAWASMPAGTEVEVEEIVAGSGPSPTPEDVIFVRYTGKLPDGTVFDQSRDLDLPVQGILPAGMPMLLGQMLPGFQEGLTQMRKGGKYELFIPAEKAYGAMPPPQSQIPPDSPLIFEIELIDVMSQDEADRRVQIIQQMMQQQDPQAAPGAPPAP
jgi:FKBP-type peptidyl-prolyl cis-trans isomerase FkpA